MHYRRLYQPGARYFFTVVTENREPLLIDHIERLRAAFRLCLSRYPFEIDAIVVLPEHLHTIWRLPENDADFSKRWMVIKRKFSAGLPSRVVSDSKTKKREKGIWQRRFWEHYIRDEEDWRRHVDYIHFNPVKHGYVSKPQDWPHSSFNQAVRKGWYEPGIVLDDQLIGLNHENIGNE
jgi:putative transposase